MLNKILIIIALGIFTGVVSVEAQPSPTAPARVKGRIVAARVQGHVDAISKAGGQARVLHDGDLVTDETQIVTAAGANVILVFSNGATVNVAADSTLNIDEFEQDPFAADLKVSDLKEEPGTSTTKINLTKGELVGKVVHLNVDKGSEFTVQTPVGAAGIRGTTFRIIFRPGPNGTAFFSVVTAEGRVVFTGTTSTPVSIPAGKQVVVTFNVDSGTPTTPLVPSNVPAAEAAQIQTASQAIVNAVVNTSFTGSGGGGGGTNNAPPAPVPPPPTTTSGSGSG